jgi:hypothetical protein
MGKKYLFELDVDLSAAHVVNPQEFFSKALLGDRTTKYFRQFVNINSKTKIGSLEFDDVIAEADCDFSATDSNLSAKLMEPCKLALGVELCQFDLQNSFVAEYMGKSNTIDFANTSGLTPEFLAHYYDRLGAKLNDNLEKLTFRGSTGELGATASGYLALCDGLEVKLKDDNTVVGITATSSAITPTNVIAQMQRVYEAIPVEIVGDDDLIWLVSNDFYQAYVQAVANASAELFYNRVPGSNFIDVEVIRAKGLSSKKMILTKRSNLIFLTDLVSPASELITINMKTTTGDRKLRTISDFTFGVDYVNPTEIVYYSV